jgi:hypothetical protein
LLIGDDWDSAGFSAAFLETEMDVASLNVHADHWGLGSPLDAGIESGDILSGTAAMERAVYYTPGCHSGLNIPDRDGNPRTTLDLPQAFLRRGANWIGNTGYGIGGDGTPLSEQVMLFLGEELLAGSQQSIGLALMRAKQRYYASLPEDEFGSNDEKVMEEVVLYGLPMATLETPLPRRAPSVTPGSVERGAWEMMGDCPSRRISIYFPDLETISVTIGTYFQASNPDLDGSAQSRPDLPIQPQLLDEVSANVRGVVFEGGEYTSYLAFDPVVTRIGDSDEPLGEETAITDTLWLPTQLVALKQLETLQGTEQWLVMFPGQYRGSDELQRTYEQVEVSLYSSTANDWLAPFITAITDTVSGETTEIAVTATDDTGICRVLVTYTDGRGTWESIDLAHSGGDMWQGTLPLSESVEYFVQVVDDAGNVSVDDNEGRYYQVKPERFPVYFPLILRNASAGYQADWGPGIRWRRLPVILRKM